MTLLTTNCIFIRSKNKKCKSPINPLDWNHIMSNMLMTRNAESRATPRYLEVSMKTRTSTFEQLGDIVIRENEATLYWKSDKRENDVKEIENRETSENKMPKKLKKFINRDDEPQTGCATSVKQIKTTNNKEVLVSGMDDDEWWTTVMSNEYSFTRFSTKVMKVTALHCQHCKKF